jgi:NADH oxidase (H2O2-forming)
MRVVIIGNGIAANTVATKVQRLNGSAEIVMLAEEPYPLYSPCVLPYYVGGKISRDRVFIKKADDYSQEGIKILFGQKAVGLDASSKCICFDAGEIAYDRLILATGSDPVIPAIDGIDKKGIFTLKSITDADNILQYHGTRAVVVGSGPIGIEAALALKKRGHKVSVVELLDRILPRVFDQYFSRYVKTLLEEKGVEVLTNETVLQFLGSNSVEAVVTDKRQIRADIVILAVGMRPRIDLAQVSGIEIGGLGGIKTNDHMLTSTADVYACGDCVQAKDRFTKEDSLSLLWHNALQQAEVAGSHCAGLSKQYAGSLNLTVIDILDTQAVSVGQASLCLGQDNVEVIDRHWKGSYYRLLASQGILVGAQMIGHARDMGILLSAMLRRDEPYGLLKRLFQNRLIPSTLRWYGRN